MKSANSNEAQPHYGHLFDGPVFIDDCWIVYADGVTIQGIVVVDLATSQVLVKPFVGEIELADSAAFMDDVMRDGTEVHTDSTNDYPKKLGTPWMVDRHKGEFTCDNEEENPRVSTNLAENSWIGFRLYQASLGWRRRMVSYREGHS